jgi:hypothetical protein
MTRNTQAFRRRASWLAACAMAMASCGGDGGGTFSDNATTRQQERAYAAAVAKVTPFGGETCNPADDPVARPPGSSSSPAARPL